jgi:hypothetical protein
VKLGTAQTCSAGDEDLHSQNKNLTQKAIQQESEETLFNLMIAITSSVGGTGRNKPVDVMVVQHLLNLNYDVADYRAPITGILDEAMIQAIKRFQQNALGIKKPDGRIDPGGRTFAELAVPGLGWIVGAPAVRARPVADLCS